MYLFLKKLFNLETEEKNQVTDTLLKLLFPKADVFLIVEFL